MKIHSIYFSPAYSTRKVARAIAEGVQSDTTTEYDITLGVEGNFKFDKDDLVIICMPVYAGRIPALAAQYLAKFTGNQTPVVIACVYGNREYDDALLELSDISIEQGFRVIGAGAFIARHSIFPKLAAGRPDENDITALREFGRKCSQEYIATESPQLKIKGNRPYKVAKRIPLVPTGNRNCTECGACAKKCPVGAIDPKNPKKTNADKCIGCTRCIIICPQNARNFRGIKYKLAGYKFVKTFSMRKENEIIYPHNEK